MGYRVAVAGATGNVGREILNILHERNFPADEIIPLASEALTARPSSSSSSLRTCWWFVQLQPCPRA